MAAGEDPPAIRRLGVSAFRRAEMRELIEFRSTGTYITAWLVRVPFEYVNLAFEAAQIVGRKYLNAQAKYRDACLINMQTWIADHARDNDMFDERDNWFDGTFVHRERATIYRVRECVAVCGCARDAAWVRVATTDPVTCVACLGQ